AHGALRSAELRAKDRDAGEVGDENGVVGGRETHGAGDTSIRRDGVTTGFEPGAGTCSDDASAGLGTFGACGSLLCRIAYMPTLSYTTLFVLQALAQGHRFGFDVMDATGLPSGTIYPALRRLEAAGFVESAWEDDGRARRAS